MQIGLLVDLESATSIISFLMVRKKSMLIGKNKEASLND